MTPWVILKQIASDKFSCMSGTIFGNESKDADIDKTSSASNDADATGNLVLD